MLRRLLISILSLGLIVGGVFAVLWLRDNKIANFTQETEIYVRPETDVREVIDSLTARAGVKSPGSLERSFRKKEVSEYLSPGHYTISPEHSSVYVARMLNNGWQTPVRLTLSGTLRKKNEIARKISRQMMVDSATVHEAFCNDSLLAQYGYNSVNLFSLLMPATYEVYWTASIEEILQKQKDAQDAFWTEENLAKARNYGLTRETASILASIVKGETNNEPEMPKIAGVYLNRLKIGMRLQADPTIAFCYDYTLNRILNRHLKVDSPYNTYLHAGLPPGPITVPTKAALEAVLNPDFGGEWGKGNIFFCANSDFSGTHVFARTLSEHNANARAFRNALNRRNAERRAQQQQ